MHGHFAVFDEWTEVDSIFEGNFLERIAPGAFKKTFRENRAGIRVTFQHGYDPFLGDKVLGKISRLEEDSIGAAYEVPLFRGLPDLVMEGLRADAYGASFRFRVMREEFVEEPDESDDNPHALSERTIKEAHVVEFGPVTYPAYPSATAGVRAAGEGADEELTAAPSKADADGEESLGDARSGSEPVTSSEERREPVKATWPKVTDEEWEELWNRKS
jgi:HK97 family phage prohead protease